MGDVILDCADEFLTIFGQAFSKFDAFSAALKSFEELTGTKYTMSRTFMFNEGTLDREFLVYKSINFVCIRHDCPARKVGKKVCVVDCPAYFTVRTMKHKLVVRHYDMQHNHGRNLGPNMDISKTHVPVRVVDNQYSMDEASDLHTVKDCTEEFEKYFPCMSFSSFKELQEKLDDFQIKTGCRYVKTNTRCLPTDSPESESLVYSHLVYICYRYGTNQNPERPGKIQRTAKINCRSKIYIFAKDKQLHVRRYDLRHNHDVRPELVNFPPKRRRSNLPPLHLIASLFQSDNDGRLEFGAGMKRSSKANVFTMQSPGSSQVPQLKADPSLELQCPGVFDYIKLPSPPAPSSDSPTPPRPKIKATRRSRNLSPSKKATANTIKAATRSSSRKKPSALDNIIPELDSYLKRLGELATFTDTDSFLKRLEELKELGDRWRHQDGGLGNKTGVSEADDENPDDDATDYLPDANEFAVTSSTS